MKKLFIFLTMLVVGIVSSWAYEHEATNYTVASGLQKWNYSTIFDWIETSNANFHASKIQKVNADGSAGTEYTMNSTINWRMFGSNQSQFYAPGPVLRYNATGKKQSSDCSFTPLTFGGIIVNELQADNTPYKITGSGTRYTELGNGTYTTYFEFNKSFTFNRSNATQFKGTVNLFIAKDAVFNANEHTAGAEVTENCTLKMSGEGQLKTTKLVVNGVLDFSELGTTGGENAFIDANLTLNKIDFKFAEGADVNSFKLCTGTLTGPAGTITGTITIGTTTYTNAKVIVNTTDKKISFKVPNEHTISSGTENFSDLTQYTKIIVKSGAKLNVNQKLTADVEGEGEIEFTTDTKQIENATVKGVKITSSGLIAPLGVVTLDGITNNITSGTNGYAFVGGTNVTMYLKGTIDFTNTNSKSIGLSSGSWIIVDGTITLAGLLFSSTAVGNNTSVEVKQNSTLTLYEPTSGTAFNIIRKVINAGTIYFNGDVKETISADITGTVNIASGKTWILTNVASGQHVWSAIRGSAGEGTLQVPAGKEIISADFLGSITVNVKKLKFDGSGDVICCGNHTTDNASFTIPADKTVQAPNATFWNKRSFLNVYGTLETANLKMGHEENGNYPGTTTIFNGGVLKTGDIIYKNKDTNNEIIVNEGGTLEFSSITKEDTQQMTANMKLTATNAILKTAALPATKDGDNYVIAQEGTFSISGTPLSVGETNYGIAVADSKALVKAHKLTVGSLGYATFCLPYQVFIPSGIYAYKAQLDESTVNLTKINQSEGLILPQETGVVINSEPGEYEFIAGFGTAISVTDNSLVGLTEDTTLPQGAYILTKSGDKAVFKQATGTLKANKAYLNAGSNSRQQLSIIWTGDDPTGISSIFNTNNPEDGKFFHNGRIFIVKDGIMYNVAGQMMK
ncbi:MAG: hypothetical protein IJQ05_06810 [Bacteroidaceae bacterium]|nr:hypothetical protein [Bacteroidaceae bacterium]